MREIKTLFKKQQGSTQKWVLKHLGEGKKEERKKKKERKKERKNSKLDIIGNTQRNITSQDQMSIAPL